MITHVVIFLLRYTFIMQPDQTKIDKSFDPYDAVDFGTSYFLVLTFPPSVSDSLEDCMMAAARELGEGLYVQPARSMHITVLDLIDPIIDPTHYGYKNKAELWNKIGLACEEAIKKVLSTIKPFNVTFDNLAVTDSAVILTGSDDGQLQKIRTQIMGEIDHLRLPRSKQPPTIIHSSLARYKKVMDLELVRRAVAEQEVAFTMRVDRFTLRNQTKINCLEYTDIQVYDLA